MRILVFQHIPVEHPGVFREFLAADRIEWDAIELDRNESIPSLDGYDALWVMGGPMDVWEEDKYPWLVAEKAAIRAAVSERQLPFLGVCLGHQLLADALGGRVALMRAPEVGILDVELTPEGQSDPLFGRLPRIGKCLQWHGAEVVDPPPGTQVLARSPACPVQAMRFGAHAYGLQYHVELTAATVHEWGDVPAYEQALERTCGRGALPRLDIDARRHMADFNKNARRLYDNFMTLLGRP
jgi:GMP synthase-like glutamine amidotransferase